MTATEDMFSLPIVEKLLEDAQVSLKSVRQTRDMVDRLVIEFGTAPHYPSIGSSNPATALVKLKEASFWLNESIMSGSLREARLIQVITKKKAEGESDG